MDFLEDVPMGMISHDELYNILKALRLTGGCDDRTLAIVAQAVGLSWPPESTGVRVIEEPFLLLADR